MRKNLLLIISVFILSACSLKYEDTVEVSERVPEFVFQDTEMIRYENQKMTFKMKADILEQYKNTSETYAKNVEFYAYNKENTELETEGSCDLLFTDTEKKVYELYDKIQLINHKEKISFYADVLRWDSRNEQLISGRGDIVKVVKDDTVIRGTGFAASGISKTFSFRGNVTGDIETKDDSGESKNE